MKNFSMLLLVVLIPFMGYSQNDLSVLNDQFSDYLINQVKRSTISMNLSDTQNINIAELYKHRSDSLASFYKNSDNTKVERSIKKYFFNNYINIVGEDNYRLFIASRYNEKINKNTIAYYSRTKTKVISNDTIQYFNNCKLFISEKAFLNSMLNFDSSKESAIANLTNNFEKDNFSNTVNPSLQKIIDKKYSYLSLTNNQIIEISNKSKIANRDSSSTKKVILSVLSENQAKLYRTKIIDEKAKSMATRFVEKKSIDKTKLDFFIENFNKELVEIDLHSGDKVKQSEVTKKYAKERKEYISSNKTEKQLKEETEEKLSKRVSKITKRTIDKNKLNNESTDWLNEHFTNYLTEIESTSDKGNISIIKNKYNQQLQIYLSSKGVETKFAKRGMLKYSNKLNLTDEQKKDYLEYISSTDKEIKKEEGLKSFEYDYDFIKSLLNSTQFNKYLLIKARPSAKSKTKKTIRKIKKTIKVSEEGKTELFNYYLSLKIARLRYIKDTTKQEEVINNINQSRSKTVIELLATMRQAKSGKEYRKSYAW